MKSSPKEVIIHKLGVVFMNRLKELRLEKGLKQSDVAKLLKCAPTAVSKYELGQLDLSSSIIHALCDIFGVTADYLLSRSAVPESQLTDEEEALLVAWRRSDERARAVIDAALEPFRQDTESEKKVV